MTLSQRIREFRYSKGWGPDELADRANISRTALYQIECGRTEAPRAGTLCRIAKALGVGVESLLNSTQDGIEAAKDGETWQGDGEGLGRRPNPFTAVARMSMTGHADPRKAFEALMSSPYADTVAQLVLDMHRLLPESRERSAV
jgi:transcriptional regulator with XRE-family HTH domain